MIMMRRLLLSLVLSGSTVATGASSSGCAALGSLLPGVIAAVTDGAQILDMIERFVGSYFAAHPDAEAQRKVGDAVTKCRLALNAALRTAEGTKALTDEQVGYAFDDFKKAYLELRALTGPLGVRSSGRLAAAPGTLEVPEPLAFHPRRAAAGQ